MPITTELSTRLTRQEAVSLWALEVRRGEEEVSEVIILPGVTRDQHSPELNIKPAGYRESAQVKISEFWKSGNS